MSKNPAQYDILLERVSDNRISGELNRSFQDINDTDTHALSKSLKTNNSLQALYLGWNEIGATGAQNLAESLADNGSLQTLVLCNNDIGDQGAQDLAKNLASNTALSVLDLSSNNITDEGAETLAQLLETGENTTLVELNLEGNTISILILKRINICLERNRKLAFKALVDRIRNNQLIPGDINEDGVLDLREKELTDADAQALGLALATNTTVKRLDITNNNNIGTEGAKKLIEGLKDNKTLSSLEIHYIKDSKGEFIKTLADVLETNTTLLPLEVEGVEYSDIDDESLIALIDVLETNPTLTRSEFASFLDEDSDSDTDEEHTNPDKVVLKKINNYSIFNTAKDLLRIRREGFTEILGYLEYLDEMDFGSFGFNDTSIQTIAKKLEHNTIVKHLNVKDSYIKDTGVQALAEMLQTNKTLTRLDVSESRISPEGAKILAKALTTNNTLTHLDIRKNRISTEGVLALVAMLETNTSLTTIDIDTHGMDKTIRKETEKKIKNYLARNRELAFNAFLGRIGNNQLTSEDMTEEGELLLIGRKLTDTHIQALAKALSTNTTVKRIYLDNKEITDTGLRSLASTLQTNNTVTYLNLSNNNISDEGAQALVKMLETNTSITTLNLRKNNIKKSTLASIDLCLDFNRNLAFKALTKRIGNNQLTTEDMFRKGKLDLTDKKLTDDDAQSLAKSLTTNTTVKYLNIGKHSIGDKGAQALADMLETNTTLAYVDINNINVTDRTVLKKIYGYLMRNHTLVFNDLLKRISSNQLTSEDIDKQGRLVLNTQHLNNTESEFLANALATNTTVKKLYFPYSQIGNTGALALAKILETRQNTTLTKISFEDDSIDYSISSSIEQHLAFNRFLERIKKNVLTPEDIDKNGVLQLQDKKLTYADIAMLIEALPQYTPVTSLKLPGKPFLSPKEAKVLEKAFQQRKAVLLGKIKAPTSSLFSLEKPVPSLGNNHVTPTQPNTLQTRVQTLENNHVTPTQHNALQESHEVLEKEHKTLQESHEVLLQKSKTQALALQQLQVVVNTPKVNQLLAVRIAQFQSTLKTLEQQDITPELKEQMALLKQEVKRLEASKADQKGVTESFQAMQGAITGLEDDLTQALTSELKAVWQSMDDTTKGQRQNKTALKVAERHLKNMRTLMQVHTAQLATLSDPSKLQEFKDPELSVALADPKAQEYYHNIIAGLNQIYLAAMISKTPHFTPEPKRSKYFFKFLKVVGKAVPVAGDYLDIVTIIGEIAAQKMTERELNHFAALASSPEQMTEIAKTVARTLVLHTTETPDRNLCKKQLNRMLKAVFKNKLKDSEGKDEIVNALVQAANPEIKLKKQAAKGTATSPVLLAAFAKPLNTPVALGQTVALQPNRDSDMEGKIERFTARNRASIFSDPTVALSFDDKADIEGSLNRSLHKRAATDTRFWKDLRNPSNERYIRKYFRTHIAKQFKGKVVDNMQPAQIDELTQQLTAELAKALVQQQTAPRPKLLAI